MRLQALFFSLLVILSLTTCLSAFAVQYELSEKGSIDIDSVLILKVNKMDFQSAEQLTNGNAIWLKQSNLSLGLPIDPKYSWFKFTVTNKSPYQKSAYLVFGNNPLLKSAVLITEDNQVDDIAVNHQGLFEKTKPGFIHEITLAENESKTYVLSIESEYSGYLSLSLSTASHVADLQYGEQLKSYLVLGGLSFGFLIFLFALGLNKTTLDGLIWLHFCALALSFSIWFGMASKDIIGQYQLSYFLISFAFISFTWTIAVSQTIALKTVKKYALIGIQPLIMIAAVYSGSSGGLNIISAASVVLMLYLSVEALRSRIHGKHFITTTNLAATLLFAVILLINVNAQLLPVSSQNIIFAFYSGFAILAFLLVFKPLWLQRKFHNSLTSQVAQLSEEREKAKKIVEEMQQEAEEALEVAIQERTLELNIALQELEEVNRELEKKNTTDELSGLYNRRFFDQRFLAEFRRSKRELTPLSLVLIDIDFFKKINDTYGHLAGDECIRQVGQTLKLQLKRSSDVACRYGGEEFCLILPHTEIEGAYAFADSLRQIIAKTEINIDNNHIDLTISCGVVTYQQENDVGLEQIFQQVDQALYLAKESGRNNVQRASLQPQ